MAYFERHAVNSLVSCYRVIDDLRKSRGLHSVNAYRHGLCILGDSGGVVNSLEFCPASLKSLGCFHFRCVLSSQWIGGDSEFANFTLPTLNAFFEARSHNVLAISNNLLLVL